jgi:hypothetical protein
MHFMAEHYFPPEGGAARGYAVMRGDGAVVRLFAYDDWTRARAGIMARAYARECERILSDALAAELEMLP